MKRYRFRLETVLRVRRAQETVAAAALLSAQRRHAEAVERRDACHHHYLEVTGTPTPAPLPVADVLAARQQAQLATAALVDAGTALGEARAAANDARDAYLLAASRVSILERLDERRREEHRLDSDRTEADEVDDVVVGRYGRDRRP